MTSLNRDFNVKRVERYLVLARQSGAVPVVILTKADLVEDAALSVSQVQAVSVGVDVISVSIVSGMGIDLLNAYLTPGKTAVFLGMSGVGKSSLLNAMIGRDAMATGSIREDDSRGRHTTTHRELFMLPSGAMIIDTPGMRTLGMWEAGDGLGEAFSDIEALLGICRFSDCMHETEPGCAIRAAIESGEISEARLQSYLSLQRESAYAESKAALLREKSEKFKSINKWHRQNNSKRGNK